MSRTANGSARSSRARCTSSSASSAISMWRCRPRSPSRTSTETPCSGCTSPGSDCRSTSTAQTAPGSARSPSDCVLAWRFELRGPDGAELGEVRARSWRARDFAIIDAAGRQIANVTEQWRGLVTHRRGHVRRRSRGHRGADAQSGARYCAVGRRDHEGEGSIAKHVRRPPHELGGTRRPSMSSHLEYPRAPNATEAEVYP